MKRFLNKLRKFRSTERNDSLIVKIKKPYLLLPAIMEFLRFILSLLLFIFPIDVLLEVHQLLGLIYLFPLFPLYYLIKKLYSLSLQFTLEFDKTTNRLLKNGRNMCSLDEIEVLQWNIETMGEGNFGHMELITASNQKIRISTALLLNKEHCALGKKIARFLKIEFHNMDPMNKEVLYYGRNDLSDRDIELIDNTKP